jgi:hypothetical protein
MSEASLPGRDADLAAPSRMTSSHRLVPVTGVGGVGKTRLALAATPDAQTPFSLATATRPKCPGRSPTHSGPLRRCAGRSGRGQRLPPARQLRARPRRGGRRRRTALVGHCGPIGAVYEWGTPRRADRARVSARPARRRHQRRAGGGGSVACRATVPRSGGRRRVTARRQRAVVLHEPAAVGSGSPSSTGGGGRAGRPGRGRSGRQREPRRSAPRGIGGYCSSSLWGCRCY